MSDGRSKRKSKVIRFIDRLERDRQSNLRGLITKAKMLEMEGFEKIDWEQENWVISAGRLIKVGGKNTKSVSLNFRYSPKLGQETFIGDWDRAAKSLMMLRFHRRQQNVVNQRDFINIIGYVAYSASQLNQKLTHLTPETLDLACKLIFEHYSDTKAYNLHKMVGEFAGHCDANGLCRIVFSYKYARMKRPESAGGINHKRLDNPSVQETKSDKIIEPLVFKIIGELYQNVPREHKYRFYILLLSFLAFLGRRYSEISLLPYQKISQDIDGREYIEYFPRKQSEGDDFTPRRKLYMPSDVLPLVRDVIQELDEQCKSARETTEEMCRVKGADIRFLSCFDENKRFYRKDFKELGFSPDILKSEGWLNKNGFCYFDSDKSSKNGKKPVRPKRYTSKEGLIAFCNKDYSDFCSAPVHIDQQGGKYYLNDLLLVRHPGGSGGTYWHWIASECTHSMFTTFLRSFPDLAQEYAHTSIDVDFTSHHFRHTLNTLLDEGGLSDLLQTEWFGRSNPKDTKAYQHTSREKRALMLREDIKKGNVSGKLVEQVVALPINVQDAVLKARVNAVHDVGTGICVHNFSQTPCERHLQCSADCNDYVWAKDDKGRLDEQKRQYALTSLARETAEQRLDTKKPKKSSDWLAHNNKKLKTLSKQLTDNGVIDFDSKKYLEELNNG